MATTTLAGKEIEVDAEGYLLQPDQWDRSVAEELAEQLGLGELTVRHWQVIEYMRNQFLETGTVPSMRAIGKNSGVPIKEIYALFPNGGPAKAAARLGGMPKPHGCV